MNIIVKNHTEYFDKEKNNVLWRESEVIDTDTNDYILYRDLMIYSAKIGDVNFYTDDYGSFKKQGRGKASKEVLEKMQQIKNWYNANY